MFESMSGEDAKAALSFLFEAAIDIEVEKDPHTCIEKILTHARNIFHASAGSISLIDGDYLQFEAMQNDEVDLSSSIGTHKRIPLSKKSIAGYVALTGEPLHIKDPYHIPEDAPYRFNPAVDQKTGFRTQSIVAMPLRHPIEGIIGTFEILNPKSGNSQPLNLGVARSFAVIASVSIVNMQLRDSLMQSYLDTLSRLGQAAEYKDKDTFDHIQRIRYTSQLIARYLDCSISDQKYIFHASAMHDVGKVAIPDAILGKKGKLSPDEWEIMKTHTTKGATILGNSDSAILKMSADIALYHHERWDGDGYPNGLKGEEIPLPARIVSVADVFDALVHRRVYKRAWPLDEALKYIKLESGKQFDPRIIDAFFACKEEIAEIHLSGKTPESKTQ